MSGRASQSAASAGGRSSAIWRTIERAEVKRGRALGRVGLLDERTEDGARRPHQGHGPEALGERGGAAEHGRRLVELAGLDVGDAAEQQPLGHVARRPRGLGEGDGGGGARHGVGGPAAQQRDLRTHPVEAHALAPPVAADAGQRGRLGERVLGRLGLPEPDRVGSETRAARRTAPPGRPRPARARGCRWRARRRGARSGGRRWRAWRPPARRRAGARAPRVRRWPAARARRWRRRSGRRRPGTRRAARPRPWPRRRDRSRGPSRPRAGAGRPRPPGARGTPPAHRWRAARSVPRPPGLRHRLGACAAARRGAPRHGGYRPLDDRGGASGAHVARAALRRRRRGRCARPRRRGR